MVFVPDDSTLTELVVLIARLMRPATYLELGLRYGDTIRAVLPYVGRAVGVDVVAPGDSRGFDFHCMTTDEFFRTQDVGVLDMAFIDADHSHEQSLLDFTNVLSRTADGGLIFLHDTYPRDTAYTSPVYCGDSYRTAWAIRRDLHAECEIVTLPHSPGLSIVRKCTRQLQWMTD